MQPVFSKRHPKFAEPQTARKPTKATGRSRNDSLSPDRTILVRKTRPCRPLPSLRPFSGGSLPTVALRSKNRPPVVTRRRPSVRPPSGDRRLLPHAHSPSSRRCTRPAPPHDRTDADAKRPGTTCNEPVVNGRHGNPRFPSPYDKPSGKEKPLRTTDVRRRRRTARAVFSRR